MKIRILGTESLGVRGLSCVIEVGNRKISIDPGIALGWSRYGLLPHPFQIAVGVRIRTKILAEMRLATDVVFSHFDGDHIPLAEANPYQLSLSSVIPHLAALNVWAKGAVPGSGLEESRRKAIEAVLTQPLPAAEGLTSGPISFSLPVAHGLRPKTAVSVMMTRIEDQGEVFVHASDVQFLHDEAVDQILGWEPDIVFSSGPPLYLPLLSASQRKCAKFKAIRLSKQVKTLIIDHHLLRTEQGLRWLNEIASASGNRVICAAEYMHQKPLLLEAWRKELYKRLPVPQGWHAAYIRGDVEVNEYLDGGWKVVQELRPYVCGENL